MSVNNLINRPLKVATAFSGGLAAVEFALKYENIEHQVIFACEYDKYARKQYLQFHSAPGTFYEDIRNLNANKYKNQIDLFVWGSPCQDLSLAGKRKGFNGEKSSLFREGARVQKEMIPKVFIFENVEGLLSSNNGADYKEVCRTFRNQGYHLVLLKMNTKDYGIPQNRPRIFIVGFLDVEDYTKFKIPGSIKLKLRLKDLLEDEVEQKYFLKENIAENFTETPNMENQAGIMTGGKWDKINESARRVYKDSGVSPCLHTFTGGNTEIKVKSEGIRKLTPFECFRLQGVKDRDIKLVNSDTQSYKIAGNAISVNVMQQLLKSLYKQEELEKTNLFDFVGEVV